MSGVGEEAADVALLDHEGRPVRLSTFWQQRPIVLLFERHFG